MASKYDEDVYENPFFSRLMTNYPSLLSKAVSAKGIVCVPKFTLTVDHQLSESDVLDHILLPAKETDDGDCDEYVTLSKWEVQLGSSKVITKGFPTKKEVEVLFAETFHSDSGDSYRVFCLDSFLNKVTEKTAKADRTGKNGPPANYQSCIEMLWSHAGGQRSRDALDRMLASFSYTYDRLEGENLRSIVDAANTHFTKAMQLLLKDSVVRKSARHNASYMENLKISVETYVMNTMHKQLFRVITATMASQDAELNKIIRNLTDLQLTDLGIRKIFNQNIPPAKKELSFLNRYSTPLGRLFCMKRVVSALTKPPKQGSSGEGNAAMMSTDDLLPILIFLIIKSETPNWYANLVYMRHFHFAKLSDDDEYGFYLATVEAALEHIRSGNVRNEILPLSQKRERWNSVLSYDMSEFSPKMSHQVSQPSITEEFFRMVQDGEEKNVQAMLEKPHKTSEEIHLKLCHPLCSCDKCDKLLSTVRNNSDLVTAYTRDNRGYTALHMAAYYGQGILIDVLIKNHAVVDATDYLGLTPLHLACQRGYQNVMLLLLHFEADVMATDNEGNTPLHLCCANGHEDCVKALVFYDGTLKKLNLNTANEIGDTPLHLAAKWGFEGIIRTLIENNADAKLVNRKRQTPAHLAQNVKVQRLLLNAEGGHDYTPYRPFVGSRRISIEDEVSKSYSSSGSVHRSMSYNSGLHRSLSTQNNDSSLRIEVASLEEANNAQKRKKKEKLFKAIIEGDIQLVKFYLGVIFKMTDDEMEETDGDTNTDHINVPLAEGQLTVADLCHPLCQCPKCLGIQKAGRSFDERISVNTRTPTGSSLLHTAVLHNHSDIVSLLISLGADVSCTNHKFFTPLHLACCMRNSLITDILLKADCQLNGRDINGDTPLLIAASNGFINGIQMLIKAGADVNIVNVMGNTAIHEAVKRDFAASVEILVNAKADVTIRNKQDFQAIDLTDDPKIREMLQNAAESFTTKKETSLYKYSELETKDSHTDITQGQISIKDLFAAFEEDDLHTLQNLTASIRTFDRKGTLRRTLTRDSSEPFLTPLAQAHSITSFDKGSLKKVKSFDKSEPLFLYNSLNHSSDDWENDSSKSAVFDVCEETVSDSRPMEIYNEESRTSMSSRNMQPTYHDGPSQLTEETVWKNEKIDCSGKDFSNSDECVDVEISKISQIEKDSVCLHPDIPKDSDEIDHLQQKALFQTCNLENSEDKTGLATDGIQKSSEDSGFAEC